MSNNKKIIPTYNNGNTHYHYDQTPPWKLLPYWMQKLENATMKYAYPSMDTPAGIEGSAHRALRSTSIHP